VRASTAVQVIVFVAAAAALAYLVTQVSTGWADWIVFGVIVLAALGGAIAVFKPDYPSPWKKRRFRRDSDSRW